MRDRTVVIVYLDLDPVPGSFHTAESAREHIEDALKQVIPHYKPKAYLPGVIKPPKEDLLIRIADRDRLMSMKSLAAFANVDSL